jgi:hypothetical protein
MEMKCPSSVQKCSKVKTELCLPCISINPRGVISHNTVTFLVTTKHLSSCSFPSISVLQSGRRSPHTVFSYRQRADSWETEQSIECYGNGKIHRTVAFIDWREYCERLNGQCMLGAQLFIFVLVMDSTSFVCVNHKSVWTILRKEQSCHRKMCTSAVIQRG